MCKRCKKQGYYVEENRGQEVVLRRKLEELEWCGCERRKVVCSLEGKAQQGSAWAGDPESTAKEESSQRKVRKNFKMLRKVWLHIRVEKIDTHEGVTVKALLDSSTTGVFMDKRLVAK